MKTLRLRVIMRDVVPQVERVIDVPTTITLDELHEILQVATGWTASHLHQFRTEDAVYTVPFEEWGEDREVDERGVRLSTLPSRFVYTYDLGDSWLHDVEVLGRGNNQPGCVDGQGACPPEDCGGPGGYAELLDALADPRHREHESMRTCLVRLVNGISSTHQSPSSNQDRSRRTVSSSSAAATAVDGVVGVLQLRPR